ncbi:hypothetical protein [Erythrobacter sp. THAF29]|uniref:hypothetical protein n=1 Tax=Erythrobacter sp. THAF29 TaxID=2587851 RepID=UPI0012696352|nr:hypothetical protein [Erythrobacter sp. THAF29]QFT77867.1 hypothetical protein FIU90_10000 [Erythrobacter sp. THAF29]
MRVVLLPICAVALIGASGETPQVSEVEPTPETSETPALAQLLRDPSEVTTPNDFGRCADRIRQAREEMGLPELKNERASPDRPLLFYAVNRIEEGCGVLVMKGNPNDIRMIPEPPEGPIRMISAESGR